MSVYNVERVNEVIANFKNVISLDGKQITVLFDADNTLYRFSTYKQSHLAVTEMYTKGFFKGLPIFPEAVPVIENLQKLGIKCGIMSTLIDTPFCLAEKQESFKYYFPMIESDDIYLIPPNTRKSDYVTDIKHTILVDDYFKNINDWYEAGGIGIKKSYSGKKRPVPVVTSLIDLFSVLKDLNVY